MKNAKGLRQFTTFMKPELIQRLRLEAVRIGAPMQDIVTGALEKALPRDIKITVGKSPRRRTNAEKLVN
jgi:hypothetical protein